MTVLTVDEQLAAFLELWESRRVGQIEKYRLAAERHEGDPTMVMCYLQDRRTQAHYEHDLAMLRELHRRALR